MREPCIAPDKILQLGSAFWGSKTLLSAIELDLFTHLAQRGPLSLSEVREDLSLHERSARDFLDALVALGMLQRLDGCYANTPETELYLDRTKLSYVGGILEMMNGRLYRSGATSRTRSEPVRPRTRPSTASPTCSRPCTPTRPGLSCFWAP